MRMYKPAANILVTEGKGAGSLTVSFILQFFSLLVPPNSRPLSRINLQSFAGEGREGDCTKLKKESRGLLKLVEPFNLF